MLWQAIASTLGRWDGEDPVGAAVGVRLLEAGLAELKRKERWDLDAERFGQVLDRANRTLARLMELGTAESSDIAERLKRALATMSGRQLQQHAKPGRST